MKNYVQPGDVLTLTAPYAVNSGDGLLVGSIFAVATATAANGAVVEAKTTGVFTLTAVTADTAALGAKAYWDNAAKKVTTTVGSNTYIGVFVVAKTGSDTTATVRLNGSF